MDNQSSSQESVRTKQSTRSTYNQSSSQELVGSKRSTRSTYNQSSSQESVGSKRSTRSTRNKEGTGIQESHGSKERAGDQESVRSMGKVDDEKSVSSNESAEDQESARSKERVGDQESARSKERAAELEPVRSKERTGDQESARSKKGAEDQEIVSDSMPNSQESVKNQQTSISTRKQKTVKGIIKPESEVDKHTKRGRKRGKVQKEILVVPSSQLDEHPCTKPKRGRWKRQKQAETHCDLGSVKHTDDTEHKPAKEMKTQGRTTCGRGMLRAVKKENILDGLPHFEKVEKPKERLLKMLSPVQYSPPESQQSKHEEDDTDPYVFQDEKASMIEITEDEMNEFSSKTSQNEKHLLKKNGIQDLPYFERVEKPKHRLLKMLSPSSQLPVQSQEKTDSRNDSRTYYDTCTVSDSPDPFGFNDASNSGDDTKKDQYCSTELGDNSKAATIKEAWKEKRDSSAGPRFFKSKAREKEMENSKDSIHNLSDTGKPIKSAMKSMEKPKKKSLEQSYEPEKTITPKEQRFNIKNNKNSPLQEIQQKVLSVNVSPVITITRCDRPSTSCDRERSKTPRTIKDSGQQKSNKVSLSFTLFKHIIMGKS